MKNMKQFTKCAALALAMCFVMALSVTANANPAAEYKRGTVYVNPDTTATNEYVSVTKMRMTTYSKDSFEVVFPRDAALTVTSNSPKLEVAVTELKNADFDEDGDATKVRVTVKPEDIVTKQYYVKNMAHFYYDSEDGSKNYYYYYNNPVTGEDEQNVYELTKDAETGAYYYYDYSNSYYENGVQKSTSEDKIYVTPNWEKFVSAKYVDEKTGRTYRTSSYSYRLYKDQEGFYIKNDDLTAYPSSQKQTYVDGSAPYEYATAKVSLCSGKAGTYKVTVSVNGAPTVMTVYVTPYGGSPIATAKLNKQIVNKDAKKETDAKQTYVDTTNAKISSKLKTAKLTLTPDKGIKINGMVVASVNKSGKAVYKKTKNKKKIALSQQFVTNYRSGVYGSKYKSAEKHTYVFVSYKDKYLGTSVTYSVVNKHGVKQIKCVEKTQTGRTIVTYLDYTSSYCDLNLWAY